MARLDLDYTSAFPVLDPLTFPTNEGSYCVRDRIIADTRDSNNLKIVTGYAGMEELIEFISEYAFNQEIEIVIGHEPSMVMRKSAKRTPEKLADEMREYWLNRGFSPRTNASVLEAIRAIESGRVRTKIHTERFLHAKATVTETAATFGSSNFSRSGLEHSRELNGRHLYGSREFVMINDFVKGCWDRSENFDDRFLELLKELQLYITWEEALARACAALLEGHWAANLLPPNLKSDFQKLWPHQQQAIAQALTLLETQGAAVIADPTGSGKTRIGGWLFRLAYNRMISRGGEFSESLIPVMVAPSSVINNWYQTLDSTGCPKEIISMGLLSNSRKPSTQRRLKLIEQTNLLGVDEIHNYYNENSKRTKALNSNLAESRIFATATPINRGFGDLITLMRLLGTEDLDSETVGKMKYLEEKIKDPNPKVREQSINETKDLIGRFMVRRTRDELKSLANERPDEYKIGERFANYADYITEEYPIGSINEEKLISSIEEDVSNIIGICRINKITQTKAEFQTGISEEKTLQGRLRLAAAISQYQIWKTLDSSPAALYEHVLGTEAAEGKYRLNSGKSPKTKSKGMVEKLKSHTIPEWGLSEDLKDSETVPEWITDYDKFEEHRTKEIETYKSILEKSLRLSDYRINSKLKIIEESYKEHGKPLAFDSSIITLAFFRKKLEEKSIETHVFSGGDGKEKKKKVEVAEGLFGLHSDHTPRIGLLSDSMSEGINLQGSNVLIHLTYPTTVRKAEQRVGRVDRMDTKFDEITIYYPERDAISKKMKAHLKERSRLVRDIIGSNIKLPGMRDEADEIADPQEIEMTSSELSQSMFTNREGLFDAFHGVRKLIGEGGIISSEIYEMMRTSEAKVVSCIGLVRAEKPWCFAVIQTNKDWAPQWIHLDWTRKDATANSGIVTDTDEICRLLRGNLKVAENIDPSNHSDMIIGEYLDHLSNKEIQLLPMRRRALLKQMSDVIIHWCRTKFGWQTEIGGRLRSLSHAANGSKSENLDLRQLATQWVSFVKEHRENFQINNSISRRGKMRTINLLKDNPPEDIESFLERFSIVDEAEEFDTRVLALIAGIPDMKFWDNLH